ncbi:MAG: hypothetical protein JXB20_04990 [Bacilli bacterium]|nr:hypothetical protein [Bacilli bacterium]MBN2696200.1 hypothetical protein [Bacilli bacterium]
MKFRLFTRQGYSLKALLCLGITVFFFLVFFGVETFFPPDGCETIFSCPTLTIPMFFAWLSSLVTCMIVIMGIIKHRVLSVLTFGILVIQGFITVMGIAVLWPAP